MNIDPEPGIYFQKLRGHQEDIANFASFICEGDSLLCHYVLLLVNEWYMIGHPAAPSDNLINSLAHRVYDHDLQLMLNRIVSVMPCPDLKTRVRESFFRFFDTYALYHGIHRRLRVEE